LLALLVVGVVGAVAFWLLTMPRAVPASELPAHTPELTNGEYIFTAGGCAECHAASLKKCDDHKTQDKTVLTGGRCLKTPFGVFNIPNISPDKEHGIGTWSTADFVTAMKLGMAPGGEHLYPAFPYASYQRMTYEDLIDLKAYLDTLPASSNAVPDHDLAFPFNIRRGLGLWQKLYVDGKAFVPDPAATAELKRGGYLVMAPGHCAECHSSRNIIGGIVKDKEFAGAKNPAGRARFPTSRRATTASATGATPISSTCWRMAISPMATWSAAPWRRCRRTWPSSPTRTARRSLPISRRCGRAPTPCRNLADQG
jgi:mono/diheme cytochrome c family protein